MVHSRYIAINLNEYGVFVKYRQSGTFGIFGTFGINLKFLLTSADQYDRLLLISNNKETNMKKIIYDLNGNRYRMVEKGSYNKVSRGRRMYDLNGNKYERIIN